MAKEEGWYYRSDSKWRSMPELMLCYRSATLFTRLYAPEIAMGIQTTEEVVDTEANGHASRNGDSSRPVFEPGPTKESKSPSDPRNTALVKLPPPRDFADAKPTEASMPESAANQVPFGPAPAPTASPAPGQYNYLKALCGLISLSKHSEANVLRFLRNTHRCEATFSSLAEMADKVPDAIIWAHDIWQSLDQELTRMKKGKAL
jgi:hypothetical protein